MGLYDSHGVHAGSLLMSHSNEIARKKPGDGLIDRWLAISSRPDEVDVDSIAHLENLEDLCSESVIEFTRDGLESRERLGRTSRSFFARLRAAARLSVAKSDLGL